MMRQDFSDRLKLICCPSPSRSAFPSSFDLHVSFLFCFLAQPHFIVVFVASLHRFGSLSHSYAPKRPKITSELLHFNTHTKYFIFNLKAVPHCGC